jgi:hypothetical protein
VSDHEFPRLYDRFKSMLAPYAARMHVTSDTPAMYGIDMAPETERDPSTWFAGTRLGKRYVSYYLMPVYVRPSLLDGISPELRRRMQGKSCFNFATVDEPLLAELEALTRMSYEATGGDPRWGAAQRADPAQGH